MISDMQFLEKGDGRSLRDTVYKELKEAILCGDIASDERLMEIPLANKMGVSRTPVREAIRRLAKEHLVVITRGKGARVAGISDKEAKDALEVRIMIEAMSVRLAAHNITPEQVEYLREINNKAREAAARKDRNAIAEYDNLLHRFISEASGNTILFTVARFLEGQVLRYRIEYIKNLPDFDGMLDEHDALIEALEKGEDEKAESLITTHIISQKDAMSRILARMSE